MVAENDIKSLIEKTFNVEVSSHSKDLMDLGLIDSIESMRLLTILEAEFKMKFTFIEYTQKGFFTIESIAHSINIKS